MNKVETQLREGPPTEPGSLDDALAEFRRRADREGLVEVAWTQVDTPVGTMLLATTDEGLVRVALSGAEEDIFLEDLADNISPRVVEHAKKLDPVRRQFDEYFDGERTAFDVPVDWRLSHGFRRSVLEILHDEVPFGHVVSYKELAERAGRPRAHRAVGSAMATNPVPIVVPCHRVLRTGGALGGYGGGLDMKLHLLRLEGALLN
jgi:methylated-DNA-[protein]-cysteine S-methyltransferase